MLVMGALKRIAPLAIVLFMVLLMGCIKVDISEKIHPDGMADFKMTINMSGMANLGSMIKDNISFGDNPPLENNSPVSGGTGLVSMGMQDSGAAMGSGGMMDCGETKTKMEKLGYSDIHCEMNKEQLIMTITAKRKLTEKDGFKKRATILGAKYSYRPNMTSLLGNEGGGQENSNPAMAKAMGISMTYTVEMPGKITKVENGEIVDGKAVFDLLEAGNERLYIESEESRIGILAAVGVALLVIALFLWLKTRRKPRMEAPPVPGAPNPEASAGPVEIDYDIVKTVRELEKAGHGDSTIAAKLKEMGYSPADINRIMEMASKVDGVEAEGKAKKAIIALAGAVAILVVMMAAYAIFFS